MSSLLVQAQTGTLTGHLIDKATGGGVPFANVVLVGTSLGGTTDDNGRFEIEDIPTGEYGLKVSLLAYQQKIVKFELLANQTLNLGSISLETDMLG